MSINWADVAVILIISISAYIEYRKGFLLSVFKTLSFIFSIFLCWTLQPIMYALLEKSFVNDWIHGAVENSIIKQNVTNEIASKADQMEIIDNLQIPNFLKDILRNGDFIKNSDFINFDELKSYIINFITNICLGILAVIIVFIMAMVIVRVLRKVIELISKIPILKEINELFGLALGIIIGTIEVWLSFMVITLIFNTNANFEFVFNEINTSVLAKFLYENNLLNYILTRIFT